MKEFQPPRLETPQTAHIRASYPTIEYLENGYCADWLKERCDQLLELAREERAGINANKLVSGAVLTAGFFFHALSPLAPIGAVLGIVGYVSGCFVDASRTGKFSPLPFVRGNILDLAGTLGNAELREMQGDEKNEFEELQTYLSPRERKEYQFLSEHFAVLTEYLTQVEPLKRFHAYRWIFDSFLAFKGTMPGYSQVEAHMVNVAPDVRVNQTHLDALEAQRLLLEQKKEERRLEGERLRDAKPRFLTDDEFYGKDYRPGQLGKSKPQKELPAASSHEPPMLAGLPFNEQMNKNAWDILQSLVTDADKSKLGGCVILAAPGAGKTTYLGVAWGRLKETFGSRFTSLAIVVKQDDIQAFRGVSDNCLGVEDSPREAAIAILRFIADADRKDDSVRRLFLDDFLTMNEIFKAALGGMYINPKTFDVVMSKKEDIDAQPLLPTLYAALNKLWLVGRQNNAALWVSSHSSNVDALPFVGSRESRSVGDIIFLARNDKREFIEQAINNPNLIGDNTRRQEIKAQLMRVEPEVQEPLVLANFHNWTFGIVSNEVHQEYQKYREEWEKVEPIVHKKREKLSDVIQNLERSLLASSQETKEEKEEELSRPKEKEDKKLTDLANRLLSFFGNAKNKEPKTLADIKKKDELREQGDIKLTIALTELVNTGHLVFDDKDSWSKSDW